MPTTLIVRDETTGGKLPTNSPSISSPNESTSANSSAVESTRKFRISTARIAPYSAASSNPPTPSKRLTASASVMPRQIDWKQQFEKAIEAFDAGRVLILVNDKQMYVARRRD